MKILDLIFGCFLCKRNKANLRPRKIEEEIPYLKHLDGLKASFEENRLKLRPSVRMDDQMFEKICVLGKGCFGKVYLVQHRQNKTYHAMKVVSKAYVIAVSHTHRLMIEKTILACMKYPFIINLNWSFKDDACLYFVTPFLIGGDLFSCINRHIRFQEDLARFYAAQILLALEFMHHCCYVYRDLKPENILIDATGYLKLIDMGYCKYITGRTYTFCGTPDYMAPEIINFLAYGKAVDWWSYGVLIFEMCAGHPPFTGNNILRTYENIVRGKYKFPFYFSNEMKNLISNLLQRDLSKRLGNLVNGARDIKRTAFHT
ncbi:cAMP-dependent protein kinase catalytic subunit [Aethina tumida]|uniref:cAMP-dependent protein kinase catalytic subunit n=1 Tax=Aethina tumida TaxID=116153 RepID=UPI00096B38A9|nr:cAMP-dependent protein kinase catalytic subunit [Aethina tumida]